MIARPPKLLISVRDVDEAREALAGGADWIDLKEPRRGALGPVDAATARAVVECVGAGVCVSAAAGELSDWGDSAARELLSVTGITHLKLGLAHLADADWNRLWKSAHRETADAGKSLVAVIYADAAPAAAPPWDEVIAHAADSGAAWVLWDTFDKSGGSIVDYVPAHVLSQQLDIARAAGLRTVVAGRLAMATIERLPLRIIEMIAVRGAACRASRDSAVCRERVAALRDQLARHGDCCSASRDQPSEPHARQNPHRSRFS